MAKIYVRSLSKVNVVEYGKDVEDFVNRLSKNIRDKNKINKENEKTNMINLSTIVGMHYFIQLTQILIILNVYFFTSKVKLPIRLPSTKKSAL